jgi:hypothetical protein
LELTLAVTLRSEPATGPLVASLLSVALGVTMLDLFMLLYMVDLCLENA